MGAFGSLSRVTAFCLMPPPLDIAMSTMLRLVASNPNRNPGHHHDAAELHRLALRLSGLLRQGNTVLARAIVRIETLTPIEMGVVSTWMVRSGVPEPQILAVVAGKQAVPKGSTRYRSA